MTTCWEQWDRTQIMHEEIRDRIFAILQIFKIILESDRDEEI